MKIWLLCLHVSLLLIFTACGVQQSSDEDADYSSARNTGLEKSSTSDSTMTTEEGGTVTTQVRLTSMPLSAVTITPTSSDTGEGTVSPATLSFTNQNWNSYQTLTITGVDDNVTDGTQSYQIDFPVSTNDPKYSTLTISALSLSNKDDEVAGVVVGTISGNTSESGASATFTVKLNSQPEANVTLSVTSSNTDEGTVSPSSLEFTTSNWSTNQTITVTGVDDSSDPVVDGDISYSINLGNTVSSSTHYNDLQSGTVELKNTDSESPGVTLSSSSLTTAEDGTSASFTVKLDQKTTSDVTINLQSDDPGEGVPSPSSLTFTTSNYSSTQTITVAGVDDGFYDGDQSYTIALKTISGTGTAYAKQAVLTASRLVLILNRPPMLLFQSAAAILLKERSVLHPCFSPGITGTQPRLSPLPGWMTIMIMEIPPSQFQSAALLQATLTTVHCQHQQSAPQIQITTPPESLSLPATIKPAKMEITEPCWRCWIRGRLVMLSLVLPATTPAKPL